MDVGNTMQFLLISAACDFSIYPVLMSCLQRYPAASCDAATAVAFSRSCSSTLREGEGQPCIAKHFVQKKQDQVQIIIVDMIIDNELTYNNQVRRSWMHGVVVRVD